MKRNSVVENECGLCHTTKRAKKLPRREPQAAERPIEEVLVPDLVRAVIENAKVQAYTYPILGAGPRAFIGGPVLPDTADNQKLRHHRWGRVADSARSDEIYNAVVGGDVAYGGAIIHHYGHMVAEAIHRIVPARMFYGSNKFLFVSALGDRSLNEYPKFPGYIKDMLRFLEIHEDNIAVINENSTIENLMLVEQGCSIGSTTNEQYLDIMREFSDRRLCELHSETLPSKRVYVCGKKDGGGIILGETYLQSIIEQAGFWVFRPEEHPFSFQLYVYSQAEMLIFSEGSAVHTVAVLGREALGNVSLLVRRPGAAGTFRNGLIGRCKSLQTGICAAYLGTAVLDSTSGNPAVHLGVSVYNVQSLKLFFSSQGLHTFYGFDRKAYFRQCEEDLLSYMKHCLNAAWSKRGTAAFAEMLSLFELCKNNDVN
jgi:hypothetical protein